MTPKEFNDCLNRIKNGDNRGLEPIYIKYYEKLVLTANCDLRDRGKAEEVASSVMVTILKNAGHYDYIKHPDAWMYKAVKFAVIRCKQNHRNEVLTDFSDFTQPAKDERITFKLAFCDALKHCSPRQREIIQLHFVYALNIRQTAKTMGISVSTVKREISAIREKLKSLRKSYGL
jgi:RNA polymerase sigma factor, sigma-70 family